MATWKWPRRITRRRRNTWAARSGRGGMRGWSASSMAAWEQIAIHVRHEQGRFSTHGHIWPRKRSTAWNAEPATCSARSSAVGGPHADWAQAMLTARGIEGTRVLQGLLALTKKHSSQTLENACETALSHGCFRCATIRQLLKRQAAKASSRCRFSTSIRSSGRWTTTPTRRAGDPSPGGSPLRGRRF
jgi:hypothetical protein